MARRNGEKKEDNVAVAIDKDKTSQYALNKQIDSQAKELFLPFRCFCTRKEIKCTEVAQ
ncbi:hypothetical protein Peur_031416 [Populus x canadensis]